MLQYNTNLTNLLNDAKHNSVLLSMHCTATIILINKISLCKLSYINGFLFHLTARNEIGNVICISCS